MRRNTRNCTVRSLASLSALMLMGYAAPAQVHINNTQPQRQLLLAAEQYRDGNYAMAAQTAKQYLALWPKQNVPMANAQQVDEARYYLAAAQLYLQQDSSEESAKAYLLNTANPVYRQRVAFALAQYYFRQGKYDDAVAHYELAGIDNLNNEEIAAAKFELAYCYFNNKEFDKAEPLLASIKELSKGNYYSAGNYYYGLLAYNQNNYADALQSFQRIENEPQYRRIVPYYVAEIYYFTGERAKALQEAQRLINASEKSYYDNELHLLAAQCLYEEERYQEALPYFEHYYDNTDKIRKEDLYEMGYTYYRVNQWNEAIDKFKTLNDTQDSLGQTAMYLLGDCYLKTNDKKSARNAFSICADMPYNPSQREDALMLAAKLSYELGYPDEATNRLNTLLADYPASQYRDEARTLYSDLLSKSSNYAAAFESLQDVGNKNASYYRIYQKVTYGYAMMQLQNGDIQEADNLLGLSLAHPEDADYEAAANFWKGEIAYRQRNFADAARYTQAFLDKQTPRTRQISNTATEANANLTLGYAAMEQKNYAAAQGYFSKAHIGGATGNAQLREADAYFMQKDFAKAVALYDKVIAANGDDADYARFQKSIVLGLQGKHSEKTTLLQSLINRTPPSKYAADARYEIGLSQIEADKYAAAIATLTPLTQGFDSRNLAPKAWMKIGFAYQELNNDDKAIDAYRHVVVEYPNSEERPAALDALKSLYIETNQPNAYAQLLRENNLPAGGGEELDSTYYAAAEAQYASGKWDKAIQALGQYIQQYPNGIFTTKAHYYKAESHYQKKQFKEALADYNVVLQRPWSEFSENSARRAAVIAYQDKDYKLANTYYGNLRNTAMGAENLQHAYNGLMRTSFELKQFEQSLAYADTVDALPNVDAATKADAALYRAKSLQQLGRGDEAITAYKQVLTGAKSAVAAEARYQIAAIYLQQGKLKEAEEAANTTIRQSAGNDYWIVKSYLVLVDVLVKQNDYFNAKATLQSIIKNTKIAELKAEAQRKLEEVKTLEKQQSKLREE